MQRHTKRQLRLLKNPDGSWMHSVTLEVAAAFLALTVQQIRNLVRNDRLASEGSHRQRRILVSSLLAFEPYGPKQRSANTKAQRAKLTPEESFALAQKGGKAAQANIPPEERSRQARERSGRIPPKQRLENAQKAGKARWANIPPEERSRQAREANAKLGAEKRRERARKGAAKIPREKRREWGKKANEAKMAKYTKEDLRVIAKKGAKKRAEKMTPEKRNQIAAKLRAYNADLKASKEELLRLKAIENGAAVVGTTSTIQSEKPSISVPERLLAARKAAGLSRAKVAKELDRRGAGVSVDAIINHERKSEKANLPRPKLRTAYAAIYGKSESELFG